MYEETAGRKTNYFYTMRTVKVKNAGMGNDRKKAERLKLHFPVTF